MSPSPRRRPVRGAAGHFRHLNDERLVNLAPIQDDLVLNAIDLAHFTISSTFPDTTRRAVETQRT